MKIAGNILLILVLIALGSCRKTEKETLETYVVMVQM
jgi:hypothetical protein